MSGVNFMDKLLDGVEVEQKADRVSENRRFCGEVQGRGWASLRGL